MRALLIAPHADDETLFASYLAQKHGALVAVVYDEGQRRQRELEHATTWLGCECTHLGVPKGAPDERVTQALAALRGQVFVPNEGLVIAPAYHPDGHEEHNRVSSAVSRVFSQKKAWYPTYAPRGERDRRGDEVVPRPEWIARKLAALSCYRSQIEHPSTIPWFYDLLDMREWVIQ